MTLQLDQQRALRSQRAGRTVVVATLLALILVVTACRDTTSTPAGPPPAPDPCANTTGQCTRVAAVDITGDGKPDGVGKSGSNLIIAAASQTTVVDLSRFGTSSDETSAVGSGDALPTFAPLSAAGREDIIVPAGNTGNGKLFRVFSWVDGALKQIGPPGRLMRGAHMDLWTFDDGEGLTSRVQCTDTPGRIVVYTLASEYGGDKATDYSGKEEVRYAPNPNAKGDASDWQRVSASTPAEDQLRSVVSRLSGKYFDCKSSGLLAAEPPSTAPSSQDCTADANAAVAANIDKIPKFQQWDWRFTGRNNVNRCADLSYAELEIPGTVSSPYQLMLFHKGKFQGRGTSCDLGYQTIDSSDDHSVTATYKYPRENEPNAAPSGRFTLTFAWTNGRVEMTGQIPDEVRRQVLCH